MKKSEWPFGWTVLEAGGERFREIHDQKQGKPLEAVALEKDEEEPLSPSKTMTMELEKAG